MKFAYVIFPLSLLLIRSKRFFQAYLQRTGFNLNDYCIVVSNLCLLWICRYNSVIQPVPHPPLQHEGDKSHTDDLFSLNNRTDDLEMQLPVHNETTQKLQNCEYSNLKYVLFQKGEGIGERPNRNRYPLTPCWKPRKYVRLDFWWMEMLSIAARSSSNSVAIAVKVQDVNW